MSTPSDEATLLEEKLALALLLAEVAVWPPPLTAFPDVHRVKAKLHALSMVDEDWSQDFVGLLASACESHPTRFSQLGRYLDLH